MNNKQTPDEGLLLIFTTLQEDMAAIIGSYFLDCKDVFKIAPICAEKILAKAKPIIEKRERERIQDLMKSVRSGRVMLDCSVWEMCWNYIWQALKGGK